MTDFRALAAGIASQLDGALTERDGMDRDDIASIDLANEREGLRVILRRGYGSESTRIRASMTYSSELRGDLNWSDMPKFDLETAAAMSRGHDVIARQIEAKIVQPAIPVLDDWKAEREKIESDLAALTETVESWRKRYPKADINIAKGETHNASFYMYFSDHGSIHARLYADGSMYFDRLPRVSAGQAIDLITKWAK